MEPDTIIDQYRRRESDYDKDWQRWDDIEHILSFLKELDTKKFKTLSIKFMLEEEECVAYPCRGAKSRENGIMYGISIRRMNERTKREEWEKDKAYMSK